MANRAGKKGKKPLQTTLGKAVYNNNEKDVDLSHIQKPINTSVFGLRQVLSLFQTATKEVQNYITYECDIMYECRTCRTIFRSLANFILHKREYCRERFTHLDFINNNEEIIQQNTCSENTQSSFSEESAPVSPDKNEFSDTVTRKSLLPVIERLKEKQEICQLAQEVLNRDLSSKENMEEPNDQVAKNKDNDLLLEEIATNNAAVFQTVIENFPKSDVKKTDFMKCEVMEIHGILDSDEAVLGPDGKICTFETNKVNENPIIPKNNLFCPECNLKFSTKKTLTYHIKYKHNNTRMVYVCPDCKDTFANAWCVYRHLFKVHRKTSAQIKRMRDQIHNSCVRKDQEPVKKKDKKPIDKMDKTDEENQWLSNIEGDNDFQMCGGCGKRFERKAALHSHAQMCIKRIAVCNTIKENNAKKKEEENFKDLKNKTVRPEKIEVLKGSSKRKPYLLRTYKFNEEESQDNGKVTSNTEDNEVCDVNANCEIIETVCDTKKDVTDEVTHNVIDSLSNTEDLLSPIKDFVSSPSIEKIDTEKMLHIIGITNYEDSRKESKSSPERQVERPSNTEEPKKESSRSHTASDFDLFCQSVAESLLTDSLACTTQGDIEESPPKPTKTIPLILRRKNTSSKHEKKNSILELNEKSLRAELPKENKTENNKTVPTENTIAQTNDPVESENSPSNTSFKISVKSLEDLIGVSPQDHIKNSENRATNDLPIRNHESCTESNKISDTLRANVSPEQLREKYPKCLKRKRTSSFDFTESGKFSRPSNGNLSSNKQDVSFISRASPFMDQNKLLCIPCQTTYPSLSKLLWHMSAHFSWFRFQCSRCSFISFNKLDCANHARKTHGVKKASIQSVVLPIPNWKTVLMSHDFYKLSDENELSGKLTDEILSGDLEEATAADDLDENVRNDEGDDSEWSNRLFMESRNVDYEPENDPLETDAPLSCIKQESIDVVNNDQESFQIEVPQEIYSLNVSEIIEGVNCDERNRYGTRVKVERIDDDDDMNIANLISMNRREALTGTVRIKTEVPSDTETNEKLFNERNDEINSFQDQSCFNNKNSEQTVNTRPTRNRTRSIKTIQDDFFYDLSKVIKLNDTSVNKSNLHRHRKSVSQRNNKESNSSSGKSDAHPLRVYAKKK